MAVHQDKNIAAAAAPTKNGISRVYAPVQCDKAHKQCIFCFCVRDVRIFVYLARTSIFYWVIYARFGLQCSAGQLFVLTPCKSSS
jgi:hypothetical protein